jgi:competence protein ComEC
MASFYGERLKSDFLKASHHGRDSGYNFESLELVAPLVTIVSVGNKPTTDASPKYRYLTKNYVASTRHYGNLTLTIHDDGSWGCSAQWNGK